MVRFLFAVSLCISSVTLSMYESTINPVSASDSLLVSPVKAWKVLPVWDNKISSEPREWYIFSCQKSFNANEWWASQDPNWIENWFRNTVKKPTVNGNVFRTWAKFTITNMNLYKVFKGNWLPLYYPTGEFPINPFDDAYKYDHNPNSIRGQNILISLPINPTVAKTPSCVPMWMIWITTNWVPIYNGLDAWWRDAVAHEVQDACGWHPEKNGQYHYHSMSSCFMDSTGANPSALIGYALDGFGIYGPKWDNGEELRNTDLDECHWHISEVMRNGKKQKIYHYHATAEYPYTIWCFKWTPIKIRQGGTKTAFQPKPSNGTIGTTLLWDPIKACNGKQNWSSCSFIGRWWETITDTCHSIDIWMVCGWPR